MYFKIKTIKGRKYKYAVKTIRLPNSQIVSLEKIYKDESNKDLNKIFSLSLFVSANAETRVYQRVLKKR